MNCVNSISAARKNFVEYLGSKRVTRNYLERLEQVLARGIHPVEVLDWMGGKVCKAVVRRPLVVEQNCTLSSARASWIAVW